MRHRSWKSSLAATACAALATCLLIAGPEARSALRPFFAPSVEGPRPFREGRPFHIRIHNDGASFTAKSRVVKVEYTDEAKGAKPVRWKVLGSVPDKHAHCLRLLLEPELPKVAKGDCNDCAQDTSGATGTGTILVTTSDPDTTSTAIPVSQVDTLDGP